MRVLTIYWNPQTDKTEIKFSESFLHSDRIVHLDVLSDSWYDLQRYYNSLLNEFKHLKLVDIVSMTEEEFLEAARKIGTRKQTKQRN